MTSDPTATRERAKYERMWMLPEYRRHSPGEALAARAKEAMEIRPGETMADFGAGPARATEWFRAQGIHATAIDFAANARETDVPFVGACLWDMPADLGPFDWGYCCDVMEHIPPERIADVLEGIAARVTKGCFFQIALFKDNLGRLIGEPLHLTIESAAWWIDALGWYFAGAKTVELTGQYLIVIGRHRP